MDGTRERKAALRRELIAARAAMGARRRAEESARAVRSLLDGVPVARGALVATYTSFGTEPDTSELNAALAAAGATLLLPEVLPDRDLAWSSGAEEAGDVGRIAGCSLVVVPGLAADRRGRRLGRGGGSYDRALTRVPAGVPRVWLGYAGELRDELPAEAHDEPVTHAALPDGLRPLGG